MKSSINYLSEKDRKAYNIINEEYRWATIFRGIGLVGSVFLFIPAILIFITPLAPYSTGEPQLYLVFLLWAGCAWLGWRYSIRLDELHNLKISLEGEATRAELSQRTDSKWK